MKTFLLILTILFGLQISQAQDTAKILSGTQINSINNAFIVLRNINLVNNGSIVQTTNSGTLKITGAVNTTTSGSGTNTIDKLEISLDNNITHSLSSPMSIKSVVTVNSGRLASAGNLTLNSDSANTARVAPILSTTTTPISGDVTVERYVKSRRAFRFLSAPVNSSTSIRTNWMENTNNPNTSTNNNPVPGCGTHITGAGSSTNGFDATNTNSPSMFTYNNQTQLWEAVPNTAGLFTAGNAYRLMVRGSRSTDLNTNTPPSSPTTLRAKGALATGQILFAKSGGGGTAGLSALKDSAGGYNFIANPYASPVDWLQVMANSANISPSIYIFDPTITGANGRGGYVAYNGLLGQNNNASSCINNNLQAGQAFFVQTTATNPVIRFEEDYKTTENLPVYRDPQTIPRISVELLLADSLHPISSADGFAVYFSNSFSNAIGPEDSYKFINPDENIAIVRNGQTLSLEGRQSVIDYDTIFIKLWHVFQTSYRLKIKSNYFDPNTEVFLEDRYLNTLKPLLLNDSNVVSFNLNYADPASIDTNRFRIVFRTSSILPLNFISTNAVWNNKRVEVSWAVANQGGTNNYEVEKSVNGNDFKSKVTLQSSHETNQAAYMWIDSFPSATNYYRIKAVNTNGWLYSKVVTAKSEQAISTIKILPNPVQNKIIHMITANLENGNYSLKLVNTQGQVVYSESLNQLNQPVHFIHLEAKVAIGPYILNLESDKLKLSEIIMIK